MHMIMQNDRMIRILDKFLNRLLESGKWEMRRAGKVIEVSIEGPRGILRFTARHPGQLHKLAFLTSLEQTTGLTIAVHRVGYSLIQTMKAFRNRKLTKSRRAKKRMSYAQKIQRDETLANRKREEIRKINQP